MGAQTQAADMGLGRSMRHLGSRTCRAEVRKRRFMRLVPRFGESLGWWCLALS